MARQESEIWYVRMPRCWLLYITQVWPTGIDDVERIFSSQTRHFLWHERKFLWHAKRSLSLPSPGRLLGWGGVFLSFGCSEKRIKKRLVWGERTGECRTCIIYFFSVCIHKTFFALLANRWRVAFTFRIKNAILNDAKLERSANELVPKLLTIAQKRCGSLHFTDARAQLLVNQNSIQLRWFDLGNVPLTN